MYGLDGDAWFVIVISFDVLAACQRLLSERETGTSRPGDVQRGCALLRIRSSEVV